MALNMLENATAIVTGGASGLGFAIAKKLSEHGAIVNVLDKDEAALRKLPDSFHKYVVDVTNAMQAQETIEQIIKTQKKNSYFNK